MVLRTRWFTRTVVALVTAVSLTGCAQTGGNNLLPQRFLGRSQSGNKDAHASLTDRQPAGGPLKGMLASKSPRKPLPVPKSRSRPAQKRADASPQLVMEIHKGRSFEQAGQWDKARRHYESLIKQHPNAAAPLHRLGIVADQQRRHTEAQRLFTRALQLEPTNAQMFNDLGYCFYLQGQLKKAESALLKAKRLDPKSTRILNNLGMVVGQQERYQEALEQFAEAGSEADAYYNLAFVYASKEKPEQAEMCFRQALAIDPQHEKAREAFDSFRDFALHPEVDEDDLLTGDRRTRLVPFVEGGDGEEVQAVDHQSPVAPNAGTAGRNLHSRAQGLLKRHFASERPEE